ncbi:MAG: endonuclease III [Deltaproteobacteria bacterium]|nr:endonuclease III [Deltaproteobacteria bacterium]
MARAAKAEFTPPDPARVAAVLALLDRHYPAAQCALDFQNPWELLVATILSAQCTDERVNLVTPELFRQIPDVGAMARADEARVQELIRSTGFFRNKAKSLLGAARAIVAEHGGQVPGSLAELTQLPGVGRKTANVVLGNAFGVPGLTVDTHMTRVNRRLGFTNQTDAVKIEFQLMEIIPPERWTLYSHQIILHGRQVCQAKKPRCPECFLLEHCPEGQTRVVGVNS